MKFHKCVNSDMWVNLSHMESIMIEETIDERFKVVAYNREASSDYYIGMFDSLLECYDFMRSITNPIN